MRRCWTCNNDHEIDAPCPASPVVRSMRSAGGSGNTLADHTSPDLFDVVQESSLGPVFTADHDSEDACCGEGIFAGEDIRADGSGGWIHADSECERMVR